MSAINSITVTGRLTKDPEIRTTASGKQVSSFTVAVDRKYKSEDKTADFIRVTAWDKSAEFIANYGAKGRMVGVTGRIEQNKFTNKDGVVIESYQIVADDVILLDRPAESKTNTPTTSESSDYDPFAEE